MRRSPSSRNRRPARQRITVGSNMGWAIPISIGLIILAFVAYYFFG